jgi:hypothetical protein
LLRRAAVQLNGINAVDAVNAVNAVNAANELLRRAAVQLNEINAVDAVNAVNAINAANELLRRAIQPIKRRLQHHCKFRAIAKLRAMRPRAIPSCNSETPCDASCNTFVQ